LPKCLKFPSPAVSIFRETALAKERLCLIAFSEAPGIIFRCMYPLKRSLRNKRATRLIFSMLASGLPQTALLKKRPLTFPAL